MNVELSERQIQILKTIIEEYIEIATPVGSETLDKKYNLGISPATIRNEMVKLTIKGFLKQPHTSAGRTPSPKALRYYVNNLLKPKDLSIAEEVAMKEKVWGHRHELDKLLKEATTIVADKTKSLSLITTEEGDIYYAGIAHILELPEFYNIEVTRRLFFLLEEFEFWRKLFFEGQSDEGYHIIVGNELGAQMEPCGLVFTRFKTAKHGIGTIGVLGSNRLDYGYVIPMVKYIGNLISQLSNY